MPEWVFTVAYQVGGAGAVLLGAALWTLHLGWWFPSATVLLLKERIAGLTVELETERREHREDNAEAERRLFNALGVAEKVTSLVAHAAVTASNNRRRSA